MSLLFKHIYCLAFCLSVVFCLKAQDLSDLIEQSKSEEPAISQTAFLELAKQNLRDSAQERNYLEKVLVNADELADTSYLKLMKGQIYCYSRLYLHQEAKDLAHQGVKRAKKRKDSLLLASSYK